MGKIPTTIPRRQLGRRLRDMRLEAGLSIQDAARLIERGAGTLQRLEKGEANRIRLLDIQALCQIYDRIDQLPGLLELAKVAASGDGEQGLWWHEYGDAIRADFELYVSLEASASKLTVYRPDIISGLFQTPAYARALDTLYFPDASPDDLDQRVRVRLNRQRIITRRRNPVEVDVLLDENALRRIVGDPDVMAGALRHLANLPENVTIRVLPFSVGFPLGVACGPFTVLDFDRATGEPPTVYVEGYRGNMYYDRAEAVTQYRDTFQTLQRVALSPAESTHLLRRVAKEYQGER
ncbi:helix-turn-helix domain-containing protein [Nocardia amamiensis]|uniref:Helix-turn-helix domain-containing protein n=1 Tax=Nocardia amamiensis TaxID=404578 RepID=A0ABS0D5X5_9NOCA|nr:helix-turn-helix transcriptional regulator [Nocardia amamiensis]MBF6302549.1 helix-turn-helix domain-containing protein [Nocardia amamiensis]